MTTPSAPSGDHGGLRLTDAEREALEGAIRGCWCDDGYVDVPTVEAVLAAHPVPEPAQVGEVGAVLARHAHPGEIHTALTEAWLECGCGTRLDVPVHDLSVDHEDISATYVDHLATVLVAAGVRA